MDIFTVEAVVRELAGVITGARIDKIHQPNPEDIVLRLWTGREEVRLLISASPEFPRIHLTGHTFINPPAPARFCQLLRSRLNRIVGIEQVPEERIIRISCRGREGDSPVLLIELLGRQPNLILLDEEEKIIDSLRRMEEGEKRREVLPGLPYRRPPAPSRHHLGHGLPSVPDSLSPLLFEKWLLDHVSPMSPLVARNLAAAVGRGEEAEGVLASFRERWLRKDFRPRVGFLQGKPVLVPFDLPDLSLEDPREFERISEAADHFYSLHGEGRQPGRVELERIVQRQIQRLQKRLEKIAGEEANLGEFESRRRMGDLLLANLYRLRKGMAEVVVEDVFSDPPVSLVIPLDPRLSPQENAQAYFQGFRKGKRGVDHVARREEETRQEMAWLEGVLHSIEEAESSRDLLSIRQEMIEEGLLKVSPAASPRKVKPLDPRELLRRWTTPGGYSLLGGKDSRTNDYVSRHLAPEDLWFHAHRLPGSHLVLKKGERKGEVPEEDILFAAALAAGYSRGVESGKVEVMVAEGKWVRKPKGARPGLVTVERYRTVVVRPRRI